MKKSFLRIIIIVFSIAFSTSKAQILVDPALSIALQNKIDTFITQYSVPGVSISVLLPGNRYWNGSSGVSDIYMMDHMYTNHLFQMASVNKMYTSAMIFQMREQGLLTLDDSVGMYLPAMTNVPASTTIRNLLLHKSGIYDIANYPNISDEWVQYPDSVWPHLQTIQMFVDPPLFPQGSSFSYSNTNYILLGMIIEQITGNTFAYELRNRFCIPYGLTQTFFAPDDTIAGPETPGWTSFTTPGVYNTNASLILNDCSASMFFTSGSIIARPGDVAKFTQLLWSGQIISDSSIYLMKQCTAVSFGDGCNGYGYGTMRYSLAGKTYFGHAGDVNGFTQLSIYQQTDSVALTISVNRNGAPRRSMAIDLLAIISQSLATAVEKVNIDDSDFLIYPNPAKGKINFRVDGENDQRFDVSILNQYGCPVKYNLSNIEREGFVYTIDVSNFADGLYYVRLKSDDKVRMKKIVVLNGMN